MSYPTPNLNTNRNLNRGGPERPTTVQRTLPPTNESKEARTWMRFGNIWQAIMGWCHAAKPENWVLATRLCESELVEESLCEAILVSID